MLLGATECLKSYRSQGKLQGQRKFRVKGSAGEGFCGGAAETSGYLVGLLISHPFHIFSSKRHGMDGARCFPARARMLRTTKKPQRWPGLFRRCEQGGNQAIATAGSWARETEAGMSAGRWPVRRGPASPFPDDLPPRMPSSLTKPLAGRVQLPRRCAARWTASMIFW